MKPSMWLIFALFLVGCGHSSKQELPNTPNSLSHSATKAVQPISEITIQRLPGNGMSLPSTPDYNLTLHSDGTATYSGLAFTNHELRGTYRTNIAREGFDRLAQFVEASHFVKFKPNYPFHGYFAFYGAFVRVSVVENGKRKTVVDMGKPVSKNDEEAPKSLVQIEQKIDALAVDAQWVKVSDKVQFRFLDKNP